MTGFKATKKERGLQVKGWVLVSFLAVLFLLYGFFMYTVVGDKGPPDWDFGILEDTPGKSAHSTYPEPAGATAEPEPQHVKGKPALAPEGEKESGK